MDQLDIKLKDHKHPRDVTLVAKDGKEFQAHRSVLSQASSFFEKLLNSVMKENNEGVIRLEMVPESQMADILEYIYTGSVQISTTENAENLFQLADYLLLSVLKAIAEKFLKENVIAFNCLPIYYLAEKYSLQGLIDICRKFIHSNFSSIADSDDFLSLLSHEVESGFLAMISPLTLKKTSLNKWGKHCLYKWGKHLSKWILLSHIIISAHGYLHMVKRSSLLG